MKQNYNECLLRLLKDEGGYSNDPNDAGGPTNFGITLADYRKYIDSKGTADSVRTMKVEDAKAIYKSKYWDALGGDSLPSGVDYTCFDYGVNSGLGRPRKALDAFKSLSGTKLIDAINDERMTFLNGLVTRKPQNQKFLKGWTNRVTRVRAFSKTLAGQTQIPTGTGTAATAAIGGGLIATFWTDFTNHWVLYSIALAAIALVIDVSIHEYKNGKINNV